MYSSVLPRLTLGHMGGTAEHHRAGSVHHKLTQNSLEYDFTEVARNDIGL